MSLPPLSTLSAEIPYSQRCRMAALELAPRLALTATDAYVSGTTVLVPQLVASAPASPAVTPLLQSARNLEGALPMLNGLLGVGHGIAGWVSLANLPYDNTRAAAKLHGVGELLTAAGFLGQAFGFGAFALPVTAIGLVATTIGQACETTRP